MQIATSGRATQQPESVRDNLAKFEIPFPPLPEQKRIVAILDEAFEGIAAAVANAEKNLANARELFESYLNAVFTQKGEGWAEMTLGDIGSSQSGLVSKATCISRASVHYPYLQSLDIDRRWLLKLR